MERKGIDVSNHNGVIDWKKVKASGISFAILRTGFGKLDIPRQRDTQFESNYRNAKAVGLEVGAYHYSYALTIADAVAEAEFVLKILKGKKLEYPIYYDFEDKTQFGLSKAVISDIINVFCGTLEKAGYWCGVYSFDSFFGERIDETIQKRYAIWVARVENKKPTSCKTYQMWQHSWKGKVNGIANDVDMDICYTDYPKVIKQKRLNGYGTTPTYTLVVNGVSEKDVIALTTTINNAGYKAFSTKEE